MEEMQLQKQRLEAESKKEEQSKEQQDLMQVMQQQTKQQQEQMQKFVYITCPRKATRQTCERNSWLCCVAPFVV